MTQLAAGPAHSETDHEADDTPDVDPVAAPPDDRPTPTRSRTQPHDAPALPGYYLG